MLLMLDERGRNETKDFFQQLYPKNCIIYEIDRSKLFGKNIYFVQIIEFSILKAFVSALNEETMANNDI